MNALRAFFVAAPSWRTLVLAMIGGAAGIVAFGPLGATLALGFAIGPDMFELAGVRRHVTHARCEYVSLLLMGIGIVEIARHDLLRSLIGVSTHDQAFQVERTNVFHTVMEYSLVVALTRIVTYRMFFIEEIRSDGRNKLPELLNNISYPSKECHVDGDGLVYDEKNVPIGVVRSIILNIRFIVFSILIFTITM